MLIEIQDRGTRTADFSEVRWASPSSDGDGRSRDGYTARMGFAAGLAPAAMSPASAATPAPTTGSPTAPAGTRASTSTTPPIGRLYAILERCVVLPVKDIKGRQTDIGYFFHRAKAGDGLR